MGLVQRLRLEHAGDAGSRVRGHLQPGDGHLDVGRTARTTGATCRSATSSPTRTAISTRRPTSASRASSRARRAGRSPAPAMPNVEVRRPDDHPGAAAPLRREPRPRRLAAEAPLALRLPTKPQPEGPPRGGPSGCRAAVISGDIEEDLISPPRLVRVARVAGRTYRFLLRMPEELRERLAAAASQNGRSLNSELVVAARAEPRRRAESLAPAAGINRLVPRLVREAPPVRGRSRCRPTYAPPARRRRRSDGARRRRRSRRCARRSTSSAPQACGRRGGETPLRLKLKQTLPGERGRPRKGPDGAPTSEFLRARTRPTRSRSRRWRARGSRSRPAARRPFRGRAASPGVWMSVGPAKALYPFSPLRELRQTTVNYVPNAYVAGGRTTSLALNEAKLHGERLRPLHHRRGRRRLAHRPRAARRLRTGSTSAARSGSTRRARSRSTRTTRAARRSTSAPARRTSAARAAWRAPASTGRRTAAQTWTRPDRQARVPGQGDRRDRRRARRPEHALGRDDDGAARACRPCCCSGVTRPVPGITRGASTSRRTAARAGRSSTTAPDDGRRLHGRRDRVRERAASARRAACATSRSTRPTRTSSTRPRTRAASGARTTPGATWTQIKPSLNATLHPVAAVDRGHTARRRRDAHVRARGQQRHEPVGALAQRQRRHRRPGVHAALEPEPGRPGLRDLQPVQRAGGGQCWYDIFVHTPKGYPDVVYTGGSYKYGETAGISNGRGVVLSTDAGVSGDGRDGGRDRRDPSERAPPRPALPRHACPATRSRSSRRATAASCARTAGSATCPPGATTAGSAPIALARCKQLLSRVPDAAGVDEQRAADAAVPEPVGQPARRRQAAGRDAGQRHVGEPRPGPVGEHDDRRRRPVRLRRRDPGVPLPEPLRAQPVGELRQRRDGEVDLCRGRSRRRGERRERVLHRR